jgi:hypothetical protein
VSDEEIGAVPEDDRSVGNLPVETVSTPVAMPAQCNVTEVTVKCGCCSVTVRVGTPDQLSGFPSRDDCVGTDDTTFEGGPLSEEDEANLRLIVERTRSTEADVLRELRRMRRSAALAEAAEALRASAAPGGAQPIPGEERRQRPQV